MIWAGGELGHGIVKDLDPGKAWDTGLAVDKFGVLPSQCDVMEAFVKPRSRPEPNLGSRILARRPGRWWRWEGSFGDLGFWEGCEWTVLTLHFPGPGCPGYPGSPACRKKTLSQTLACAGVGTVCR